MRKLLLSLIIFNLSGFLINLRCQENYPPEIKNAKEVVYKVIDGTSLNLWIFNPVNHKPSDKRPAIVFFFGGGWNSGNPAQFEKHCEYLAARGMVAMVADYRVKSRQNVLADKCVADAKSAIRWIRKNAPASGIDTERIIAAGGSAGGHLAAAAAILPGLNEPGENTAISCVPDALILFNPVLITAPGATENADFEAKIKLISDRVGTAPVDFSPYHHIKPGLSPAIIFHGIDDTTVPYFTVKLFAEKMKQNGNRCELVGYKNEKHGFFNYGRKSNGPYVSTVNKMDAFLVSLGYLDPLPETE